LVRWEWLQLSWLEWKSGRKSNPSALLIQWILGFGIQRVLVDFNREYRIGSTV
jgi:hypothetical protein